MRGFILGRISARLDNQRKIDLDSQEHRHFDHGYAVTSHSSQGLTAERVLVNVDTNVHPDLINTRFAYVSVSRASHDAQIYTNDVSALLPSLSQDITKTSAAEIGKAQNLASKQHGIDKPQLNDLLAGLQSEL